MTSDPPALGAVVFTLCALALILPGYFYVYAPAVDHLNHIVRETEQLFVPPNNKTVSCGIVECLEITYDFGIVLQGERIVSNSSSTHCALQDQACQVGFYNLLLASCNTIWYDDREPQSTITSDPQYRGGYVFNYGGGIVMFVFGGLIAIPALCLICIAIQEILQNKKCSTSCPCCFRVSRQVQIQDSAAPALFSVSSVYV